jgi:ketosteroid isomerase-like protein
MKKLVVLLVGLCLLPAAAPAAAVDRPAEEAAIRKAMERMDDAYRLRDGQALGALMADDFENWLGTDKGRDINVKAGLEGLKSQSSVQYKRSGELGVVFISPDVALYKAYWEFSGMVDAAGSPLPPMKLLGACVMVKREGKWLMAAFFSRPAGK